MQGMGEDRQVGHIWGDRRLRKHNGNRQTSSNQCHQPGAPQSDIGELPFGMYNIRLVGGGLPNQRNQWE